MSETTEQTQEVTGEQEAPQVQALSTDPVEMAATLYSLYLPKVLPLIDALSGKAAKRILKHILVDKLIDNDLTHPTEAEKNAFLISDRLLESKYVMILHTFAEAAMSELKQKAEQEETKENKDGQTEA